jgi:hypothetical protein
MPVQAGKRGEGKEAVQEAKALNEEARRRKGDEMDDKAVEGKGRKQATSIGRRYGNM